MSVVVNFAIFPLDKGESVSSYVAPALEIIKESGLPYRLGPMATSIEGEWEEVMAVVSRCFEELRKESRRLYLSLAADYREGAPGRLCAKVESLARKLGAEVSGQNL